MFFCAAVSARASAEYRTVEIEGLRIVLDSDWVNRTAPGYLPVRIDITNLRDAREIEIAGEVMRFFRGSRGGSAGGGLVRQIVRLARGDHVRLTLPVPVFADNENVSFHIRENGRTLERFGYAAFQSRVAPTSASTLIVAAPGTPFAVTAAAWIRPIGARSTTTVFTSRAAAVATMHGSGSPMDLILDPSRLPSNWLGFTTLRAVLLGPVEWQQLGDAQRSALLTWTAAGGDLIVVDGNIATLQIPESATAADLNATSRSYFFGRIHTPTASSINSAGLDDTLTALGRLSMREWALPANSSPDWGTIAARGFRLPIPGMDGVPARAYLLILVVFSFVIGPVNYWILRRRQRQVLVVLTAPLLSAAFILVLASYAVAVEGLAVYGRIATFTILDQVSRQASTRASVSLYAAGMTPSGGLRFPRDVAVFPIGPDGTGTRERLSLELTDGQRMASGVVQARSPGNFEQISHRTARERLTFSTDRGEIAVVNGLGETVSTLLYRSGDSVYGLVGPLPPGGKAVLKRAAVDPRSLVPATLPSAAKFVSVVENQPSGSYLAVLERSPFWDSGVSAVVERGSFHLVMGWPEPVR